MARKPKEPPMSFDLSENAGSPITQGWMDMLSEFRPAVPESKLTLVALPDGIDLSQDPHVRAIQLVALYRSGVIN